mmetsp:Transcript_2818/g.4346  ORF Transcript_2818/g.4346 Transcript_2818/m.4346 type:complete len:653 (-) Transcript_2818:74-2032(-)
MKVRDLEYVENQLIPRLEKYVTDIMRFSMELEKNAVDNAAAEAAKEEMRAKGEVGLPKVEKKATTRPISPNITKPRPPVIAEPERIAQLTLSHEVPGFLDNINLEKLNNKREMEREATLKATRDKYNAGVKPFELHETKGGRPFAEIQKEVEDKFASELRFDASFIHEPPDFSKQKSLQQQVKNNASAILREDAIYRKQQAKDVQLLRAYEEELRDPTEFYLWQKEMRDRDAVEKLEKVVFRREQAKASAIDAKEAILKQREDNFTVAEMLREQADVIKQQRDLENEIAMLKNQSMARDIAEARDTRPKEAGQKAAEDRAMRAQRLREEMEAARLAKIEEDKAEEEEKADKIRQLRALNTVHKKHIVVFDPTETAGHRLSSEMSYMEMKERLKHDKVREEEKEQLKRAQIEYEKQRRLSDLERRQASTLRARQVKAETNSTLRQKEAERKKKEAEDTEILRKIAAEKLEKELKEKRELAKAEQAAMKAEQERIKRQQQYLGAAMGQVEQMREEQMSMARKRQKDTLERTQRESMAMYQESAMKDRDNKVHLERKERLMRENSLKEKQDQYAFEKKAYLNKLKETVLYKKEMFQAGQTQHAVTKTVIIEHNPYAQKISEESLTKAMQMNNSKRVSMSGGKTRLGKSTVSFQDG